MCKLKNPNLEKPQLLLVESIKVIKIVEAAGNSIPGSIGQIIKEN